MFQKAEEGRRKELRGGHLTFKGKTDIAHNTHIHIPLAKKFDHMNTNSCKGIWKMNYLFWTAIYMKIVLLWEKGQENRCWSNSRFWHYFNTLSIIRSPVVMLSYMRSVTLLSTNYAPHPPWREETSGTGCQVLCWSQLNQALQSNCQTLQVRIPNVYRASTICQPLCLPLYID